MERIRKKKTVKIGLVQMCCDGSPQKNLQKAVGKIQNCAREGAQIVCLPELFLSGYFCQGRNKKYFDFAQTIPGETTEILGKLAYKEGITIVASLFEKTSLSPRSLSSPRTRRSVKFYNSTAIIGPNENIIGKYRKVHIPSFPPGLYDEDFYFRSGDLGFPAFKTPHAKISALVCYDQWFPEAARISAVNGAQILFYPTAIGWPKGQRGRLNKAEYEAWQITQRSHGIDNNIFVVAVNRVGKEGNLNFWGTSFVSDPYGRVIAKAGSSREENLVVECDLSIIKRVRKEWAFLEERKVRCGL